jgi:minor extracellular serine protease Vpr
MKQLFFQVLIGLTCFQFTVAQVKIPQTTQSDVQTMIQIIRNDGEKALPYLCENFPVYKVKQEWCASFIGKINEQFVVEDENYFVTSQINDIVSIKIPLHALNSIQQIVGLTYLELGAKIKPQLDKVLKDVRADSVHLGINLPQAYTGKHVYIGITDWGFDYTHPMFYDTLQDHLRIEAAWDQYKLSGPSPSGFGYGTEYSNTIDLLNAGSDTANIYSYSYHGTHVAGIAGGAGAGTVFRGLGFESRFLFTTFLVDGGAVLDAYQWMYNKAQNDGKRLVINQSWGLHHIGTLDGNSLLSQAIDAYSDLGVVFVSSAGNNGNVNFHIQKEFNNDTLKTKVDFYSYASNANMWGQSISMWGQENKPFSASFQVVNAGGSLLVETPYFATDVVDSYIVDHLIVGNDTVYFNLSAENAHPLNSRPHIRLRIKNKNTNFRILLKIAAESGTVHAWNVTELVTDVGNWGMPFTTFGTGSIAGNNQYGISEPACTKSTIAVAAYAAEYYTSNGNLLGGTIANFSSFGPTLDGRIKPDIAAPGVSVASSVSSFTDASFSSIASVNFNNKVYRFTRISGTSMSSPVVSGVVAIILEANPFLSAEQVKQIIIETAREDSHTGIIPAEGSVRWGHGKIDVYAAVQLALNTINVPQHENQILQIYPNPASHELNIEGLSSYNATYQIVSMAGKLILSGQLSNGKIIVDQLKSGIYMLRIEHQDKVSLLKFVVE